MPLYWIVRTRTLTHRTLIDAPSAEAARIYDRNRDLDWDNGGAQETGTFECRPASPSFPTTAPTRVELLEKLKKAVKAAEIEKAIPVTLVDLVPATARGYYSSAPYETGRGIVHAKLRGKHAREWNTWLYMTEDGKKFKFSSQGQHLCRRLSAGEVAEYERLTAAIDVAEQAYAIWFKEVHVQPDDLLEDRTSAPQSKKRAR